MLTGCTVFNATCKRSFSKLKLILSYLRASLINNKSGKVMWYSCDENRKGWNSTSLRRWNHEPGCFDKGTESFVLISIFVEFDRKRLDMFISRWNCVFRTEIMHDLHEIFCYTMLIERVSFSKKLWFAVAICCLIFWKIYTFVRQHYLCGPIDYDNIIIWIFWCSSIIKPN